MPDEKPTLDYGRPKERSLLVGCLITVAVYVGIVLAIFFVFALIVYFQGVFDATILSRLVLD